MRPLPVVLGESTVCVESIDRRKKTDARRKERVGEEEEEKRKKEEEDDERTNEEEEENRFHKHTYASIFDDRPNA